jgi:hypothetical protein
MLEATHIAPRCEARPREVIYNPNPLGSPSQSRGEPLLLGWVFWVLGLTYDQLIKGVEGTGTREGGLKVSLLLTSRPSRQFDGVLMLCFSRPNCFY